MQSKALLRSVIRAEYDLTLPIFFLHFSIIEINEYWVLKPIRKPH